MSLFGSLLGKTGGEDGQQSVPQLLMSMFARQGGSGLQEFIQKLQAGGLADAVSSWIGTGENQQVAPEQVHQALGDEQVSAMAQQTGMDKSDLLSQLAQHLPGIVDRLSPNGQLPNGSDLLAQGMNFLKSRFS
jgi:uncharacterized protein YidB (DUF937 family)